MYCHSGPNFWSSFRRYIRFVVITDVVINDFYCTWISMISFIASIFNDFVGKRIENWQLDFSGSFLLILDRQPVYAGDCHVAYRFNRVLPTLQSSESANFSNYSVGFSCSYQTKSPPLLLLLRFNTGMVCMMWSFLWFDRKDYCHHRGKYFRSTRGDVCFQWCWLKVSLKVF